jgi:hypothetical protein
VRCIEYDFFGFDRKNVKNVKNEEGKEVFNVKEYYYIDD